MYILTRELNDKFKKVYTQSVNDKEIDKNEYKGLVNIYEDYK